MLKIKVLGNYAPNLKGLPGSCYLVKGLKQPLLLDLGNGNIKSLLKEIKKDEFDNLIIVLSHNHLDHSFDVLRLVKVLKKWDKKVRIYLPKKSLMYFLIYCYRKFLDINIINEKTKIIIGETTIDFCQTFHSGESYAIRISTKNKIFVYTSDFSYVSRGLKYFCKNADVVLIDSGIPIVNKFHLKGFHGVTSEILKELFSEECNVKKVLASHLKAGIDEKYYMDVFTNGKNIELVKRNTEYIIFN